MVISLVEFPHLTWAGREEYIRAKTEKRTVDVYGMDLIWMLVKERMMIHGLTFEAPYPSELEHGTEKKKDTRSAEQIKQQMLNRLKEG